VPELIFANDAVTAATMSEEWVSLQEGDENNEDESEALWQEIHANAHDERDEDIILAALKNKEDEVTPRIHLLFLLDLCSTKPQP